MFHSTTGTIEFETNVYSIAPRFVGLVDPIAVDGGLSVDATPFLVAGAGVGLAAGVGVAVAPPEFAVASKDLLHSMYRLHCFARRAIYHPRPCLD